VPLEVRDAGEARGRGRGAARHAGHSRSELAARRGTPSGGVPDPERSPLELGRRIDADQREVRDGEGGLRV
jgi:hypothetical protein